MVTFIQCKIAEAKNRLMDGTRLILLIGVIDRISHIEVVRVDSGTATAENAILDSIKDRSPDVMACGMPRIERFSSRRLSRP